MMSCATQGHTKMGILFVYATYVYWKMGEGAYQNVTPGKQGLIFLELLRDLKITNHPLHSHMTPDLLPHTAGTQKGTTGVFTGDSDFPYGILIVVSIGVALGVFFGGLLLSVAVMYMRRYVKRKFYTDSFLSMAIQFFSNRGQTIQ